MAKAYGERLGTSNLTEGGATLDKLINGYPTHSFVIDKKEAEGLFKNTDSIAVAEVDALEHYRYESMVPATETVVVDVVEEGGNAQHGDTTQTKISEDDGSPQNESDPVRPS